MEQGQALGGSGLEFVTPLSAEDCVRCLRRGVQGSPHHYYLSVRVDGPRVRVETGPHPRGRQASPLWRLRFEGELVPIAIGTRVHGAVVGNRRLETALAGSGAMTAFGAVLALTANDPFMPILVLGLLALFAGYYWHYRQLLQRERRELLEWIYEWLAIPHGRAGGPV